MNKVGSRILFIIGWLLSPLTWWNDAFVNVPLAYVLADFSDNFLPGDFTVYLLVYYWLTNIIGVIMLAIGAWDIFVKEFSKEKWLSWIVAIIVYSIILAVLSQKGIVEPFIWTRR